MKKVGRLSLFFTLLLLQLVLVYSVQAEGVSGAIFTTDATGLLVNGNVYSSGLDVYFSGGPGPNAPSTAAGLPDGDYYFQVTDPAGKKILSTDEIEERLFRVEGNVITEYLGATHNWNEIDEVPNAIAIQLWPFGKTPNRGGVYKLWATPTFRYNPADKRSFFGFIPQYSKTDNFKVRKIKPLTRLILYKFYDVDGDGFCSSKDYLIEGWPIFVTDPLGVTNVYYTPKVVDVTGLPGVYTIREYLPEGWEQTAIAVDGVYIEPAEATVSLEIENGETHTILYGNVEIPTPSPPRIRISLYINPIIVSPSGSICFSWSIDPGSSTPLKVELEVFDPSATHTTLYVGTLFPEDLTGTYYWSVPAEATLGTWIVRITYHYRYLSSEYVASAFGQFEVYEANGG